MCCSEKPESQFVTRRRCGHSICIQCVKDYLNFKIDHSQVWLQSNSSFINDTKSLGEWIKMFREWLLGFHSFNRSQGDSDRWSSKDIIIRENYQKKWDHEGPEEEILHKTWLWGFHHSSIQFWLQSWPKISEVLRMWYSHVHQVFFWLASKCLVLQTHRGGSSQVPQVESSITVSKMSNKSWEVVWMQSYHMLVQNIFFLTPSSSNIFIFSASVNTNGVGCAKQSTPASTLRNIIPLDVLDSTRIKRIGPCQRSTDIDSCLYYSGS